MAKLPFEATPAQGALAWVAQQPGVTTVIPGARTVAQAKANAAAGELPPLGQISWLEYTSSTTGSCERRSMIVGSSANSCAASGIARRRTEEKRAGCSSSASDDDGGGFRARCASSSAMGASQNHSQTTPGAGVG